MVTADAARILGKTQEAKKYTKEANDYRKDILAAHRRSGFAYFPPSWEDESKWVGVCYDHWGNIETLWPTELFHPNEPVVDATINELRNNLCGGYQEGLGRFIVGTNIEQLKANSGTPKIVSYRATYTTLADMIRGNDEQVAEDYYWYLLHSSASNHFGEVIEYRQRRALKDTMPHVTGAAMFATMTRHMLIHERDEALHLLWGIPDWWIEPGKQIRIERAPTHFGVMNMTIHGTPDGVLVNIDQPSREEPKRIVLHLPDSRPLLKPVKGVEVVYRSDQKKRWDYPTIVKLYKQGKTYVPLGKLIE